jgi:hypothetical protein
MVITEVKYSVAMQSKKQQTMSGLAKYSVDCCITFQGNIDGLSIDQFQPANEFEIRIRQTPETNLTVLGENTIDLDFVLYVHKESADQAAEFASKNMKEAIVFPDYLQPCFTSCQGVYNEDSKHWELVF